MVAVPPALVSQPVLNESEELRHRSATFCPNRVSRIFAGKELWHTDARDDRMQRRGAKAEVGELAGAGKRIRRFPALAVSPPKKAVQIRDDRKVFSQGFAIDDKRRNLSLGIEFLESGDFARHA